MESELHDEVEDEGEYDDDEDSDNPEIDVLVTDDEYTQEEGADDDDDAVEEINRQVALLGSSIETPALFLIGDDAIVHIFTFLPINELLNVQLVCSKFLTLGRSNTLWNDIYCNRRWGFPFIQEHEVIDDWFSLYLTRSKSEMKLIEDLYKFEERGGGLEEMGDEVLDMISKGETVSPPKLYHLLESPTFVLSLHRGHERLLNFLQERSSIFILLDIVMKDFNFYDNMPTAKIKVSQVAFQTVSSDLILDVLINDHVLLRYLFNFLQLGSMPSTKTNFFSKIVIALFNKYPMEFISYFKQQKAVIPRIIQNVNDALLMEMLFKLIDRDITHQWFAEANLLTQLAYHLREATTLQEQENTSQVIMNILTLCQPWHQSALVRGLLSDESFVNEILAYIKSEPLSSFRCLKGIQVLIGNLNLIGDDLSTIPLVITKLIENMAFFCERLTSHTDSDDQVELTFGSIIPFGFVRLAVLELFVGLLYSSFLEVVEVMAREKVFSIVLDLMFQYPWNNIVHHQVTLIFSGLLCSSDSKLVKTVLEECRLLDRIIEAHEQEVAVGYLGHLRQLSNEIVKVSKHSTPVTELTDNEDWQDFLIHLEEYNTIEGINPFGVDKLFEDEIDCYDDYENMEGTLEYDPLDNEDYEEFEIIEEDEDELFL